MRFPEPAVGQRLTAEFIASMLPNYYRKDNATSRQSLTSLTDDPDLQGIPLVIGRYEIELTGYFAVASTAPKLKTRWGFTGTWDNAIRACIGPGADNVTDTQQATSVSVRAYQASTQDGLYNKDATGVWANFREISIIEVSVAGNLSLQWAQAVSTASNVTMNPGTAFKITRCA